MLEDAFVAAQRLLDAVLRTGQGADIVISGCEEFNDAWRFEYNRREFLDDRDLSASLAGNGPVIVPKSGADPYIGSAFGPITDRPGGAAVSEVSDEAADVRSRLRLAVEYGGGCLWITEEPYSLTVDDLKISDQLRQELTAWDALLNAQRNDGYPPDWSFFSDRLHNAFNEMGLALAEKLALELPDWEIEYLPWSGGERLILRGEVLRQDPSDSGTRG